MKTILKSTSIFTGHGRLDGFVVTDGNIIEAVCPSGMYDAYPKGDARILELGDRTVMPAFHDAHLHLITGALAEEGGLLRYADSEEEAARLFWERNKDKTDRRFLLGGAWDHFRWEGAGLPGKGSLDKYFPDTPVLLLNKECHGAWANSCLLDYFGIDRDTPDPAFGEFARDEHGEPTGYLLESAYLDLFKQVLDQIDVDQVRRSIDAFTEKAWSYGVTAVSDMQMSEISGFEFYDALDEAGSLNLRVHYAAPLRMEKAELLRLKAKHTGQRLRFSGTKDFIDGTPMGYTGLMLEDYKDKPGNTGLPAAIDLDYLRERVVELDAAGIRVRLHACGDRAVQAALDCFEEARKRNGDMGTRHSVEHIEGCAPEDIVRFAELDVIPSVQPEHLPKYDFGNHPFHTILGEERMRYSWPFGSLLATGSRPAFGTDFCVSELNPMRGLYRAVTRLTDEGEPEGGFSPYERMTLEDSLRAYTRGSAYCNYREDDLGTLSPGMLADIAVLDRDIFGMPAGEIIDISIAKTMFDGEIVYEV